MRLRRVVLLTAALATGCTPGRGVGAKANDDAGSLSDAGLVADCSPGDGEVSLKVVASQTGGNSDPNRVAVMEAAVAEVNELGGVRGCKLRLVAQDNASSEDRAREIILGLLDDRPPEVLFGTHTSNVLPLVQLATPKSVFVFGAGSSLPGIVDSAPDGGAQYFARTTPSGDLVARRLAQLTYEDGATRVGVIYLADTVTTQYKSDFLKKYSELGGTVDPGALLAIDPASTATSHAALLASAVAGAGDVRGRPAVVVIGSGVQLKILLNDAATASLAVQWYASHGVQSGDPLAANPAAAAGLRGVKPAKGEAAHFDHYAARLAASLPGVKPEGTAYPNMYDEVLLFALTAERAGFTADKIRTTIRDVSNAGAGKTKFGPEHLAAAFAAVRAGAALDFDGASGTLELDGRGDVEARFEEFHVADGTFASGGAL